MRRPRLVVTLLGIELLLVRPAPAPAQSVASLVTSLPASFVHLFEPTNGLIVAAGGGASALAQPKDDDVARHYLVPSDGVHTFFRAGHVVGDTPEVKALVSAAKAGDQDAFGAQIGRAHV